MNIETIENKKWALGLDWEILTKEEPFRKEVKAIAEKNNSRYGISFSYDNITVLGLVNRKIKEPVAALYLALANQEKMDNNPDEVEKDWIVVEEIGDHYWMCVIKNGIPLPGLDFIDDLDKIKDKLFELLEVDTYQLYSTVPQIENILRGGKTVQKKTLNDLTKDIKTKIKVDQIVGIKVAYMITALGVVGALILLFGINSYLGDLELLKQAENIKNQQIQKTQQEEIEYQKKLEEYRVNSIQAKGEALNQLSKIIQINNNININLWSDFMLSQGEGQHGWNIVKFECNLEPNHINDENVNNSNFNSNCVMDLTRPEMATNKMLLDIYPDANIEGNRASIKVKMNIGNVNTPLNSNMIVLNDKNLDQKLVDEAGNKIISSIQNKEFFVMKKLSDLQLLKLGGITYKVEEPVEMTYVAPQRPFKKEELEQINAAKPAGVVSAPLPTTTTVSLGVMKGEISLEGDDILFFKDLANTIDMSYYLVKNIVATVKDDKSIIWKLKVDYIMNDKTKLNVMPINSNISASSASLPSTDNKK